MFDQLARSLGLQPWHTHAPVPGVDAPLPADVVHPPADRAAAQHVTDAHRGLAREGGLATALDPVGVADRAGATRELGKKLEVVDDVVGPRLPHQVTAAEMQATAKLYSDTRLGRNSLQLAPGASQDPAQFRADMMDDLGDILQTSLGRRMLTEIAGRSWRTTLRPKLHRSGELDTANAEEDGNGVFGEGTPHFDGRPGRGADARVSINPNRDVAQHNEHGVANNGRSDVVLFHELVHAYDEGRGMKDHGDVGAGDGVPEDIGPQVSRAEHQASGIGQWATGAYGM